MRYDFNYLENVFVFSKVVESNSISTTATDLGLTPDAVSQQISTLEKEMGIRLFEHAPKQNILLTEAGNIFLQSCQDMLNAAEHGYNLIQGFHKDMVGYLSIAISPELSNMHLMPDLSQWLEVYGGLQFNFKIDKYHSSMLLENFDIAVHTNITDINPSLGLHPIASIEQILCASPTYLKKVSPLCNPRDLEQLSLIIINDDKSTQYIQLKNINTGKDVQVYIPSRIRTNNTLVGKSLCINGHGVASLLYPDVRKELSSGELVEILPNWKMPNLHLQAVTLKRDQQPIKIYRCIEALNRYFNELTVNRSNYGL